MSDQIRIARELWEAAGLKLSPQEENFLGAEEQYHKDSFGQVASALYSSKTLATALDKHAAALIRSAEASEKHAKSLTRATWFLVVATMALVIVSLGLWLAPIR